jgi:hypothetical protein
MLLARPALLFSLTAASCNRDGKPSAPMTNVAPTEVSNGTSDYIFCLYSHLESHDKSIAHQLKIRFPKTNLCCYFECPPRMPRSMVTQRNIAARKHTVILSCRLF